MAKKHVCPKCGNARFYVLAHIVQEWKVDEYGNFQDVKAECTDVTHRPDDEDMWVCTNCGYDAAGNEFIVSETYKEFITRKMVEDGLMANVIQPRIENGDCKIKIGDYSFNIYHIKQLDNITTFGLAEEIYDVLTDFYNGPDTYDTEYQYYYYYLQEHI